MAEAHTWVPVLLLALQCLCCLCFLMAQPLPGSLRFLQPESAPCAAAERCEHPGVYQIPRGLLSLKLRQAAPPGTSTVLSGQGRGDASSL